LLFLFLMIMAALLYEKDEVIDSATAEAELWRAGANTSFGISPPAQPVGYISAEDMDRPLSELDLKAAEAEDAHQRLESLTALLAENLSDEDLAERLAEFQVASDRLAAIEEQMGRPEDLINASLSQRPGQRPRTTILSALRALEGTPDEGQDWQGMYGQCTDELEQCRADQDSVINEFRATLANLQPGACLQANMSITGLLANGAILHSFDVVLTDDGILVREGDRVPQLPQYEWYNSWRGSLPRLIRERPYTPTEFLTAFEPYFDRAAITSQTEVGRDGRPFGDGTLDCRFYVRIFRDRMLSDATRSEALRQAVESVFYKNERGTIELRTPQ
jgi:hypothetical protein